MCLYIYLNDMKFIRKRPDPLNMKETIKKDKTKSQTIMTTLAQFGFELVFSMDWGKKYTVGNVPPNVIWFFLSLFGNLIVVH